MACSATAEDDARPYCWEKPSSSLTVLPLSLINSAPARICHSATSLWKVTEGDLKLLIEGAVAEDESNSSACFPANEMMTSGSSFANGSGGDLIFGIGSRLSTRSRTRHGTK